MANKNTAGKLFARTMERIDRLHKEIDKKARNGKYNEDDARNKLTLTRDGARVWSF